MTNRAMQMRIARLRNFRKRELPDFEPAMRQILHRIAFEYVSAEKSVELWDICTSSNPSITGSGRKTRESMFEILDHIKYSIDNNSYAVFFWNHENIGGIILPIQEFFDRALDLVDYDGDTVFAISLDKKCGYSVDVDLSGPPSDRGYELFNWDDSKN